MTNLTDNGNVLTFLPATARRAVYIAYLALVLISGAVSIAFGTLNMGEPAWFQVANEVLKYLGVPVLAIAVQNVVPNEVVR